MDAPTYPLDVALVLRSGAFKAFLPHEGQDATGRSILEGRSIKFPPQPSDYAFVNFRDSRCKYYKPINFAALQHYLARKELVKDHVRLITNSIDIDDSFGRLCLSSFTCYRAPLLWLLRNWCIPGHNCSVPPEIAAASKIAHGVLEVVLQKFHKEGISENPSPRELYQYADNVERLIGAAEVCACGPEMLVDFLSAFIPDPNGAGASLTTHAPEAWDRDEVVLFGKICWMIAVCGLLYGYVRLALVRRCVGPLPLWKHVVPSFPRSIDILRIVRCDLPMGQTYLRGYFDWTFDNAAQGQSSFGPLAKIAPWYGEFRHLRPSEIELSLDRLVSFQSTTIDAISRLSTMLDQLISPSYSSRSVSTETLDLFFGEIPRTSEM